MVAEPLDKKSKAVPDFRPGDTVRVHIRVVEGESERIQIFEGTVIARRGSGEAQSFTVRKISFGVGVERTFPVRSPHVDRIEVVKSGRVRRSRLYYLRALTGRAARLTEDEGKAPASEPKAPAAGGSASSPSSAPQASTDGASHKRHGDAKAKPAQAPKTHEGGEARALGAAPGKP